MSESINTMTGQIVVFTLDELSYAFPLNTVLRVIHAIEIKHLPQAPAIISGIINVQGRIIPVADIRKRLNLAEREVDPDDRLIIADTGKREVAIVVDSVSGIRDIDPLQLSAAGETLPFAKHLRGVAKLENELVLIYNLEEFMSLEEEEVLEQALKTINK